MNCLPARTRRTPRSPIGSPSSAWRRRGSRDWASPPSGRAAAASFKRRKRRNGQEKKPTSNPLRNNLVEATPSPTLRHRQPKPSPRRPASWYESTATTFASTATRLNELVEIVGVVGGGLTTTGLEVNEEDDAFDRQRMEDEQAWDPPTSKVARLHALSWRRLDPSHPVPPGALDKATADSIRIALLERLSWRWMAMPWARSTPVCSACECGQEEGWTRGGSVVAGPVL